MNETTNRAPKMTTTQRANIDAQFYREVESVLDGNDPDTRRLAGLIASAGQAPRSMVARWSGQDLRGVYGARGTDAARAVLAALAMR